MLKFDKGERMNLEQSQIQLEKVNKLEGLLAYATKIGVEEE